MTYQTHTLELRKWFVDRDYDLDMDPCYVIGHLMGEHSTFYGDDEQLIKPFYNQAEAYAFAKHLNEKADPEILTYKVWRE